MQNQSGNEMKKIMFVTVILLILLVGIIAVRFQKSSQLNGLSRSGGSGSVIPPTTTVTPRPAPVGAYTINPSTVNLKAGQSTTVDVLFTANNKKLDGADAVLLFDPQYLSAGPILPGPYFGLYPRKEINNNLGFVKVTGLSRVTQTPVTSTVTFFTLTLTAKKAGTSALKFDFTYGLNNKSTLVEAKTSLNLLGVTSGSQITISP